MVWGIPKGGEWNAAFNTWNFEYQSMPFEQVNAPAIFQAFVKVVFWDMVNKLVYLDDSLIFSYSFHEHI